MSRESNVRQGNALPDAKQVASVVYEGQNDPMSDELSAILAAIPLFQDLNDKELAALVALKSRQDFAAKESILVEGQPPQGLYIILDGKVAVMKHRDGGNDHICDLDGGECVGEVEIIDASLCAASVVCHGDVQTAVITKDDLESYFSANPIAAIKILRSMVHVLAARLRGTNSNYSSLMGIAEHAG